MYLNYEKNCDFCNGENCQFCLLDGCEICNAEDYNPVSAQAPDFHPDYSLFCDYCGKSMDNIDLGKY